jgi:hypothetical protein
VNWINDGLESDDQDARDNSIAEGDELGVVWASEMATRFQRANLERYVASVGGNLRESLALPAHSSHRADSWLVFVIKGIREANFESEIADEFWEDLGVDIEDHRQFMTDFLEAFIRGARSVSRS